ncbi:MAG: DUF1013 domain-containing protein [Minwuiales bacterium]|nr:DUF1013 domain-containing protein [Minwuiales bacterium]
MPKATAVWLVENTSLTFRQIADFCDLHELEVKGIADEEVAIGIVGLDPVANGQLTKEEIERCTKDPAARLQILETPVPLLRRPAKGARYTPVSKRQDRPDAISWLLRNHPELSDAQVQKLLGTTKATINAVRDRTHWNMPNIKPQDPVSLGICSQTELTQAVEKALEREERRAKKEAKEAAKRAAEKAETAAEEIPEPAELAGEPADLSSPVDNEQI